MKKPKRKTQRNKCDRLWSELIRQRNKGCCEVCGKPANNPHHVIGRRNLTLRHDVRNGVLLCSLHHTLGRISAHQDPIWFIDWLERQRPDDYFYLQNKREEMTYQVDYEERLKELKEVLDRQHDITRLH